MSTYNDMNDLINMKESPIDLIDLKYIISIEYFVFFLFFEKYNTINLIQRSFFDFYLEFYWKNEDR